MSAPLDYRRNPKEIFDLLNHEMAHIILNDTKRDDRLRYDTGVTISTDSETEIVLTVDNLDHPLNIYRNREHFAHEIERIREWGHCPSGGAKNTMLRPAPFFAERMEFDWPAPTATSTGKLPMGAVYCKHENDD